jgi:aspartyl-tRNA(Asn)/glutamyl-tRNA(Gln) amidotransferase subunit B
MYRPTIGLEIHVELKTKTKMFCSCLNDSRETIPNKNICPICLAHPGVLPTPNKQAILDVIKVGLATNGEILEKSFFDRKNYFYPDLPKGYQISQYEFPLVKGGFLEIKNKDGSISKIRITRIHLEEDTARLIHPEGQNYSLVDFNRAGIPLMELVTEPDIHTSYEARVFAQNLQLILKYLGVSNASMEEGEMRVEPNISVSKTDKLGVKVEIKNLNSFRSLEEAIDYEIMRQIEVLENGGEIKQENRGWLEAKKMTHEQRSKEFAHDYRYFPEPDLTPIIILENKGKINLDEIKQSLPELPEARKQRYVKEFNLLENEAEILTINKDLGDYFENVVSEIYLLIKRNNLTNNDWEKLVKTSFNFLTSDLLGLMADKNLPLSEIKISPKNFAELVFAFYSSRISSRVAKDSLAIMISKEITIEELISQTNSGQISDSKELEKIIDEILAQNQKVVLDYQNGKTNALQFLIGQVIKETKGRANPKIVEELIKRKLS